MSGHNITAFVQRNDNLVEESVTLPPLEEHQVLVKIAYSAFNPTDVQSFDGHAFDDGAVLGCDFAGVVEETGPKSDLKVGDRIAALVWGGEIPGIGAYATHCIADDRISYKIPASIGFKEAVTVPLAVNTAWLALFSKDCLNISRSKANKTSVLIWGGSSTVGSYAIQIAAMHDMNIATTCSPRNFDVVKRLGATHVFDYNDKDVARQISNAVPDLAYAFDCIGNETSSVQSAEAQGDKQGVICTVRPGKAFCDDVQKNTKVTDVLVFVAFLKPHTYMKDYHWPTAHEDHALSAELYSKLPEWIESGAIKPHPPHVVGKLSPETIKEAMELNRKGKVSNQKLCFEVSPA